jgi:hypothetical protein
VAAFISNLPGNGLDTTRFSTMDASGSTSQAANVVEALESGASALLVDEDVSVRIVFQMDYSILASLPFWSSFSFTSSLIDAGRQFHGTGWKNESHDYGRTNYVRFFYTHL